MNFTKKTITAVIDNHTLRHMLDLLDGHGRVYSMVRTGPDTLTKEIELSLDVDDGGCTPTRVRLRDDGTWVALIEIPVATE